MAEKRMIKKSIVDSDLFLDMPVSSQNLYFHLNLRADDDGFIDNPKKIQRMVSCSEDDLKLLIAKQFLIQFDSGVIVIKHWRLHNTLRKDRYITTMYQDELSTLDVSDGSEYKFFDNINVIETDFKQDNVNSISKTDKKKERKEKKEEIVFFPDDFLVDRAFKDFVEFRKLKKAPMTVRAIELAVEKLMQMSDSSDERIEILNNSIVNGWTGLFPLKKTGSENKNVNPFDEMLKKIQSEAV